MTKGFIISSINIWCPAEPVFIPSRWGFVPGCWLQKAFSFSWIIQWEHPVDGVLGFETWARHLTHRQNPGLQVDCGAAPSPDPPPRSSPSPPPHFAALAVAKLKMVRLNLFCYKTFNTATFSLRLLPRCFDLATAEAPVVKPPPSLFLLAMRISQREVFSNLSVCPKPLWAEGTSVILECHLFWPSFPGTGERHEPVCVCVCVSIVVRLMSCQNKVQSLAENRRLRNDWQGHCATVAPVFGAYLCA